MWMRHAFRTCRFELLGQSADLADLRALQARLAGTPTGTSQSCISLVKLTS